MNYLDLPNLASPLLGAKIIFATDEWFAAAGKF
jgi:allantoicase